MKKIQFSLLLALGLFQYSYSQQAPDPGDLRSIQDFVEGYNAQDFSKMRSTMSTVIKLVFTEKRVRELYGLQYKMLGNATIDRVVTRSERSYRVELKYERDTTEVQTLGLAFSGKSKIVGLSNPSFKLQFPKRTDPSALSEQEAIHLIDSMVSLKHRAADFNGCVLVLKNKKEFYKNCPGYSDLETKTALNDSTLFDLASCSKQFTAMAVLILYEQGRINFTNTIEEFFPGFPYKNITIENLLTHTSGLPDYMELFEKHWDKTKIATNQDVLEYLTKYKPGISFKPGKEYEYSNTGYAVLASVIEKVSGTSFADFLSRHIFQPLGMKNSRVYTSKYSRNELIDNYAKGHTYSADQKQYVPVGKVPELDYYRYLDGIAGDGAVNSTISDLALWDNGLREYKLVRKETFDKAIEPFKIRKEELSAYGYGWELQKDDQYEKLIYHSGNWGGNITFVLHFMDKEISVIILSNNEYFNVPKFAGKVAAVMNKL